MGAYKAGGLTRPLCPEEEEEEEIVRVPYKDLRACSCYVSLPMSVACVVDCRPICKLVDRQGERILTGVLCGTVPGESLGQAVAPKKKKPKPEEKHLDLRDYSLLSFWAF